VLTVNASAAPDVANAGADPRAELDLIPMDKAFALGRSRPLDANDVDPSDPAVRRGSELVRRRRAHLRRYVAAILSLAALVLVVVVLDGDARKACEPLFQLVARLIAAVR
jgi:hypothetical protein